MGSSNDTNRQNLNSEKTQFYNNKKQVCESEFVEVELIICSAHSCEKQAIKTQNKLNFCNEHQYYRTIYTIYKSREKKISYRGMFFIYNLYSANRDIILAHLFAILQERSYLINNLKTEFRDACHEYEATKLQEIINRFSTETYNWCGREIPIDNNDINIFYNYRTRLCTKCLYCRYHHKYEPLQICCFRCNKIFNDITNHYYCCYGCEQYSEQERGYCLECCTFKCNVCINDCFEYGIHPYIDNDSYICYLCEDNQS